MRLTIGLGLAICSISSLFATEYDLAKKYVIVGEYVPFNSAAKETTDGDDSMDWTDGSVILEQTVSRENGKTETVQIASGRFDDRRISFEGEIDEPTAVRIKIQTDEIEMSIDALIEPGGQEVSFAFIDFKDPELDKLLLVGSSLRVKNPDKKFSVLGIYEPTGSGFENAIHWATITSEEFLPDGTPHVIDFGTVLVQDGRYRIEAEVEEPRLAQISIYRGEDFDAYQVSGTYVVIEPDTKIKFGKYGPQKDFTMATAESGRHAKLFDSWRVSDEYLEIQHDYYVAQRTHFGSRDPHEVLAEQKETDDVEDDEKQNSPEDSDEATESARASGPTKSEGCVHVDLADVIPGYKGFDPDAPKPEPRYEYQKLWQRVEEIERESLRDLAWNSKDPFDSLVALEIGRKYWSWGEVPYTDILRLYDKLATMHDDDVVARRIGPARDQLAGSMDRLANNKRLVPGQNVPEFTLANLQAEDVSLKDVLAEKKMVLIDFWASWCGPCIKAFPTLKEMRSEYGDDGFEIISISIDDAFEDWEESSSTHELPWIDLGEMKGYDGTAPIAFGVTFLPKTYLIDDEGCILQKDITAEELKEFVSSKFR